MFKVVFITQAKTQYIQRSKSRQMDNYDESIQKLPTNNKGATTEARSNMEESHRYVEWKKPNTYTAWFPNLQWQEAGSGDLEQEWREGDWFAHLWIARSQKPAFVKYLTKRVVTCVTFGSLFIFLLQRHSFPYNFYSVLVWVVWFLCGSSGRSFGMFNSSGPTKKKGWWPERLVCTGLGSGESCSGDRSRKVSHMVLSRHKMHIPPPLPHMHLGPWVSSECTLGIWLDWAHSKILC